MTKKQGVFTGLFLISCLAFGYFGIQKLPASVPVAIGGGMFLAGAIASVPKPVKKPVKRKHGV